MRDLHGIYIIRKANPYGLALSLFYCSENTYPIDAPWLYCEIGISALAITLA
jgi:hypothetical protein